MLRVAPGLRRSRLVHRPCPAAYARVLVAPVNPPPAVPPKETGGSPEFPLWTHAPPSDPGGVPPARLDADRTAAFQALHPVGFRPGFPSLSCVHHYTFFGVQFRGLRPRLPSASDTCLPCRHRQAASRRSPFGSATGPVASLWPGGMGRLPPTHPLGNIDEFQGVSPLFRRPGPFSARPVIWLGGMDSLRLISSLSECLSDA
jgi:hypothetical protein